jgi:hypothetical protein
MTDVLFVTYDKKNNGEVGLCVSRLNDDKKSHKILKMELDDQATAIYRLLTEQTTKVKKIGSYRNDPKGN